MMKRCTFVAMKNILGIFFSACSNDLDLFEEKKDIPIVYGLLSSTDTAHYIRVEKAFADPNGSALDVAQIPDSLYYMDAVVSLRNVQAGEEYILTMVDGNVEGRADTGTVKINVKNA